MCLFSEFGSMLNGNSIARVILPGTALFSRACVKCTNFPRSLHLKLNNMLNRNSVMSVVLPGVR